GVQTCALPISRRPGARLAGRRYRLSHVGARTRHRHHRRQHPNVAILFALPPRSMNALELTGKVRTHIEQLEEPRVALHREAVKPFRSLRAAAAKKGFDLMPFSAFRDFQAQVE